MGGRPPQAAALGSHGLASTRRPDKANMTAMPPAIERFTLWIEDDELDDLRRRLRATRWPDAETETDQGVELAGRARARGAAGALRPLGRPLRLACARAATECGPPVPHDDRRPRDPLPARPFAAA